MYCLLFILDLQSINISNVLMTSEAMTMLHTDKLCTVAFLRLMYVTPDPHSKESAEHSYIRVHWK